MGNRETVSGEVRARRAVAEIAMQAGVGSAELAETVRAIDASLFLVFADHDATDGQAPTFAPQAMADLAVLLERAALRLNAVATRLELIGARSLVAE